MMHYLILYRGPLSSCNYGCAYCPFAKRSETDAELADDRAALERFISWVAENKAEGNEISILFTPWGEALVRPWYQQALVQLTRMPHVRKAAIQTNLSGQLGWLKDCDSAKLGLWCSYHPTEMTRERFLGRCRELDALGVRYSAGIVGLKEHLAEAHALRLALQPDVYLWVNAFKRMEAYYDERDLESFTQIDPLFPINNITHPSLGHSCRCGESVFSVEGDGTMRRCHFIKDPIGNIYDADWQEGLRATLCTNETCGCHIGYVHMPDLGLYEIFGEGVPERIPAQQIWNSNPVISLPVLKPESPGKQRGVRMSLRQVSISGR